MRRSPGAYILIIFLSCMLLPAYASADVVLSKSEFTSADAGKDGMLDLLETIKLAGVLFGKADANRDGKLEGNEIPAWIVEEQHKDGKRSLADFDGKGAVDEQEFLAYVVSQVRRMDHDADSRTSAEEYQLYHAVKAAAELAEKQFEETDKNKDGIVDLREAVDGARKVFSGLDANKNGTLSAGELGVKKNAADNSYDLNADGNVDAFEFSAHSARDFGLYDFNKDGAVHLHEYLRFVITAEEGNYESARTKEAIDEKR
ncbi:MAG: hypothetical protein A2X58_06315 [Nitrospirae bacterium GWC2_56_14]|nr:MAG: hypothetical protein A2X58_06315 [Nitrospirae bacterium GWC2_56_14]